MTFKITFDPKYQPLNTNESAEALWPLLKKLTPLMPHSIEKIETHQLLAETLESIFNAWEAKRKKYEKEITSWFKEGQKGDINLDDEQLIDLKETLKLEFNVLTDIFKDDIAKEPLDKQSSINDLQLFSKKLELWLQLVRNSLLVQCHDHLYSCIKDSIEEHLKTLILKLEDSEGQVISSNNKKMMMSYNLFPEINEYLESLAHLGNTFFTKDRQKLLSKQKNPLFNYSNLFNQLSPQKYKYILQVAEPAFLDSLEDIDIPENCAQTFLNAVEILYIAKNSSFSKQLKPATSLHTTEPIFKNILEARKQQKEQGMTNTIDTIIHLNIIIKQLKEVHKESIRVGDQTILFNNLTSNEKKAIIVACTDTLFKFSIKSESSRIALYAHLYKFLMEHLYQTDQKELVHEMTGHNLLRFDTGLEYGAFDQKDYAVTHEFFNLFFNEKFISVLNEKFPKEKISSSLVFETLAKSLRIKFTGLHDALDQNDFFVSDEQNELIHFLANECTLSLKIFPVEEQYFDLEDFSEVMDELAGITEILAAPNIFQAAANITVNQQRVFSALISLFHETDSLLSKLPQEKTAAIDLDAFQAARKNLKTLELSNSAPQSNPASQKKKKKKKKTPSVGAIMITNNLSNVSVKDEELIDLFEAKKVTPVKKKKKKKSKKAAIVPSLTLSEVPKPKKELIDPNKTNTSESQETKKPKKLKRMVSFFFPKKKTPQNTNQILREEENISKSTSRKPLQRTQSFYQQLSTFAKNNDDTEDTLLITLAAGLDEKHLKQLKESTQKMHVFLTATHFRVLNDEGLSPKLNKCDLQSLIAAVLARSPQNIYDNDDKINSVSFFGQIIVNLIMKKNEFKALIDAKTLKMNKTPKAAHFSKPEHRLQNDNHMANESQDDDSNILLKEEPKRPALQQISMGYFSQSTPNLLKENAANNNNNEDVQPVVSPQKPYPKINGQFQYRIVEIKNGKSYEWRLYTDNVPAPNIAPLLNIQVIIDNQMNENLYELHFISRQNNLAIIGPVMNEIKRAVFNRFFFYDYEAILKIRGTDEIVQDLVPPPEIVASVFEYHMVNANFYLVRNDKTYTPFDAPIGYLPSF